MRGGMVSVQQWRFHSAGTCTMLSRVARHHSVSRQGSQHTVAFPRGKDLRGHEWTILRVLLVVGVMVVVLLLLAEGGMLLQMRGEMVVDAALLLLVGQHLGGQVLLVVVVVVLLLPVWVLKGLALGCVALQPHPPRHLLLLLLCRHSLAWRLEGVVTRLVSILLLRLQEGHTVCVLRTGTQAHRLLVLR